MKKSINTSIWVTIDKIMHTLCWNDAELLERLQITEKQFMHQKKLNLSPSLDAITNLTESLGISIESLINGKIDFQTLLDHASGNLTKLPERYSSAKFSKVRTSIHLLDFIENNLGWSAKKTIYNHFQINESIFENAESTVNFLMPSDICQYIGEKFKAPTSLLYKIGAHSSTVNKNSILARVLSAYKKPKELHENIFTEIVHRFYDKNQIYKILKLTNQYCIVELNFRDEVKDLLKLKTPGNQFACHSIAGSISSLTGYINLPNSKVTKIDCIHQGGCSCKFLIDFSVAHAYVEMEKQKSLQIMQ